MHPFFDKRTLCALAALAAACAPAQAAYSKATASLDNIQFQLIDLDLSDNISPSITFTSTGASGRLDSYSSSAGVNEKTYSSGFESVDKVFTFGSGSLHNGPSSMRAELHVSPVPRDLNATVNARQELNFTLSPSTRLLFTAQADAGIEQQGLAQSYAIATLEGHLASEIDGLPGYQQFLSTLDRRTGSGSEFLQGAFDTGTGVGTGTLWASTYTAFSHHTSAVPEAQTYGMLLAGLLVLGGVARSRTGKTGRAQAGKAQEA